jgi:hypothetical protein
MRAARDNAIIIALILFLFGLAATFQSTFISRNTGLALTICSYSAGGTLLIIFVRRLIKRPRKYWGVILAAGHSVRWNASIAQPQSVFYWENVKRVQEKLLSQGMASLEGKIIRAPTKNEISEHKALTKIAGEELICRTLRLFRGRQINAVYPVLSSKSEPIRNHIDGLKIYERYHGMPEWDSILPGEDFGETTHSAVLGLGRVHEDMDDNEYVIMAYSDIIWERRLLDSLMSAKGDIVVLVDRKWEDFNYPPNRIWHDKFHAELVSIPKRHSCGIEKAGEAAHRFCNIKAWDTDFLSRQLQWEEIEGLSRPKEIVVYLNYQRTE